MYKKVLFLLVFVTMIAVGALPVMATDYYVSKSDGNDANNGTSPTTPWKTIDKVNSVNFAPGDIIKFKKGDVWRNQLTVSSSGASGNPITYTSYGTGDKPLILGSVQKINTGNWSNLGSNRWATANGSFTQDAGNIIFNNEASTGIKVWSQAGVDLAREFWYDSANRRVVLYSPQNPALEYSNIEIPRKDYGIDLVTHDYITISDLEIKYSNVHGIRGGSASDTLSNINISYVDISYVGGKFQGYDDYGYPFRYGNGIEFWQNASDILVEYCNITQIFEAGLTNQSGDKAAFIQENITYRYNKVSYSNLGFQFFSQNNGTVVNNINVENNEFTNTGFGWSQIAFEGLSKINKAIYNQFRADDGTVTNFYVRDNIFDGSQFKEVVNIGGGSYTFERNVIENGQHAGVSIGFGQYTVPNPNDEVKFYYNLIYDNAEEGIRIAKNSAGGEINNPVELYNNVIVRNGDGTNFPNVYIGSLSTDTTWKNNIIEGYTMNIDTSNITLDYNCYYRGTGVMITYLGVDYTLSGFPAYQSASGQDATSIAQIPLFVDAANNDFHLSSDSPCIDSGVDVGLLQDFDMNSIVPPPDIGAFEYQPTGVPDISASPASKDFGNVAVGSVSSSQIFTIYNNGTAALVIGGVYLTGTNPFQFSILNENCENQTIAPSGSCTIEARYEPTKTGTMYAEIGVDSNDPDTLRLYIALSGTGGEPDISASPASKDFGNVAVGSVSSSQIFTIYNNGTAALVIGGVYLTGTNPFQFSILRQRK